MTIDLISKIKEFITIYDLFDQCSPHIQYSTKEKPCQIRCPFHGKDTGPSARVFPETDSIYCWSCDQSWDVLDFWADINGWEKEDGSLDIGRAIKDLADKYQLYEKKSDWKKSLHSSLKSVALRSKGYSGTPNHDRLTMLDSYSWMISKKLVRMPTKDRAQSWDSVKNTWDSLDSIDLEVDYWKTSLHSWMHQNHGLYL